MKKEAKAKEIKKLALNRETLRNLNEQELQAVAGGATAGCTVERCTGISCYC